MSVVLDIKVKNKHIENMLKAYLLKQANIFLDLIEKKWLIEPDFDIEELEKQEDILNTPEDKRIEALMSKI